MQLNRFFCVCLFSFCLREGGKKEKKAIGSWNLIPTFKKDTTLKGVVRSSAESSFH